MKLSELQEEYSVIGQLPSLAPEVPQQKRGIVQGLAQGVISPYVKTAATAESALKGVGFLGKIAPKVAEIGIKRLLGRDVTKERQELADIGLRNAPEEVTIDLGYFGTHKTVQSALEAAGVGLEIAADIGLAGGAVGVGKATLKGQVAKGLKAGAVAGAKVGTVAGAGIALQEENVTLNRFLWQTGLGGVAGAVLGGTIGGLSPIISKTIKGVKSFFNAPEVATKLTDNYNKILKITPSQKAKEAMWGKDTPEFLTELAKEGHYIKIGKTADKRLDVNTAIEQLKGLQGREHNILNDLLASEKKFISLEDYRRQAVANVQTHFTRKGQGDTAIKATKKVNDIVDNLKNAYKGITDVAGEQKIPLEVFNNIKQGRWNLAKIATRDQKAVLSDIHFQMGHTAKNIIENTVEDVNVKIFNKRLGDYAEAIWLLNKRRGIALQGGRMGRYAGAVVGGMVTQNPLGRIAGATTGAKLAELAQDPRISTYFLQSVLKRAKEEGQETLAGKAQKLIQMRIADTANIKLLSPPTDIILPARLQKTAQELKSEVKILNETWEEVNNRMKVGKGTFLDTIVSEEDFLKLSDFEQDVVLKNKKKVVKPIPKEIDLTTEAKQGVTVFRGTGKSEFSGKRGALFFTKDKNVARNFGGENIQKIDVKFDNPLVVKDRENLFTELLGDKRGADLMNNTGEFQKFFQGKVDPTTIEDRLVSKELVKQGYDGAVVKFGQDSFQGDFKPEYIIPIETFNKVNQAKVTPKK